MPRPIRPLRPSPLPIVRLALVGACLASAAASAEPALRSQPYLAAVTRFADTVLEKGRDTYGEQKTPLFVDGLHAETLEPVVWKWKNGQEWVLSNFANQQPLMRLLDGLTALGGDRRYREAAEVATRHVLTHCLTPCGLPSWGGHSAWDLSTDTYVGNASGKEKPGRPPALSNHELKSHQPYFELFWRIDPEASRKMMAAIWQIHVTDWKTLDNNRHGKLKSSSTTGWSHEFDETGPVPFPTEGGNLSFSSSTGPFLRSAILLNALGGDGDALLWARRMAYQWQRARHPKTGLSGAQLSWRVGHDRAIDALGHLYPGIHEAGILFSYHPAGRYMVLPLQQMQAGERLRAAGGDAARVGDEFIAWASDDLKVFGRVLYDEKTGLVPPRMTDGTLVQTNGMKSGYFTPADLLPQPVGPGFFWGYAMAYRLTGDPEHWRMLRLLGRQFGLGDLGAAGESTQGLAVADSKARDHRLLYGLLELHEATKDATILRMAARVGDNLLALQKPSGLFPRPAPSPGAEGVGKSHEAIPGVVQPARVFARTADEIPLSLLHLAAAIDGQRAKLPQAVWDSQYFHCRYFGDLEPHQQKLSDVRTYDWLVFYGADDAGTGDVDPAGNMEE